MTAKERLRIAIIGAGIGGLALSAAIRHMQGDRDDLEVDIYEAASHISEVGAGINFWPRTWEVLKAIGLEERLSQVLPQIPDDKPRRFFEFRKCDQAIGFHIKDAVMNGGSYRFHRADLQHALMSQKSGRIHLSHRLVSYEENGDEVTLQFEGGTTATCDILVGMDGIKSVVRRLFLTKQGLNNSPSMHPVWTGDIAYRSLIPIEKLEQEFPGHRAITTPLICCGKYKHLVCYPVSQGKFINFVAITGDPSKEGLPYDGPTVMPSSQEEVLSQFKVWDKEVQALIRCTVNPTKWIIRALQPLDRYSLGHVFLAGDAAHAMNLHQGAGAGQAIEVRRSDAYVFASLICDRAFTKDKICKVAEIYDEIRRPVGNRALEKSQISGRLIQLSAPGLEDIEEGDDQVPLKRMLSITHDYDKELEWVWKESAEADRERALSMLRSL